MSEVRELIERAYAAVNARDADTIIELATPDIVLATTIEIHHGPEGVLDWLTRLDETIEAYEVEVLDVEEMGDYVVVSTHQRGRGRASGIEIDHRFTHVWTLRDGRVVHVTGFNERAEALAAARAGA